MITASQFEPAWWLTNGHAQTMYRTLTNRLQAPIDRYERLELPDGDFIDLAWAVNGLSASAPLVVLLHGLGGGVSSPYVAGLLLAFNQAGYRGVLMHLRGASDEPNRKPRAYHSGDTADFSHLLEVLDKREPSTQKAAVGISLGGNILLKWLGQTGSQSLIQTAVAVSVPFQLHSVAKRINQGFSRLYQASLLRGLRDVFLKKLEIVNTQFPLSAEAILSLKTLREFDQLLTAPLHGFPSVDEYYQQSSSKQYLGEITTPTLIIHSLDDPFMYPESVPTTKEISADVTLELSQRGGHVGFIGGKMLGQPSYWLEERIPVFFRDYL
ncbi:MAG: alpha/beta hydrolase [Legionellales bacterium RIFCSPHIGHO2_12_FULL_42_9]|nr:MAG: alpha/beta hydrolase [Legionellales bacterium RIFCSPHIGHO2_12_FULL_42_9]